MAISDKEKVLMLQDAIDVMLDDMKALCDYAKELEDIAKDVAIDVDTDIGSECAVENKLYKIMLLKTCISNKPNCMEMYHPKK